MVRSDILTPLLSCQSWILNVPDIFQVLRLGLSMTGVVFDKSLVSGVMVRVGLVGSGTFLARIILLEGLYYDSVVALCIKDLCQFEVSIVNKCG